MTTPTTLYAVATAGVIRKQLRKAFPACTFRVTTSRGASSVTVRWTDGPTVQRVEAITALFRDGSFNGMTDSHEYATGDARFVTVDGITYMKGCRFVSTSRSISPALLRRCAAQVAAYYGLAVPASCPQGSVTDHAQDRAFMAASGFYFGSLIHQASNDRTRYAC